METLFVARMVVTATEEPTAKMTSTPSASRPFAAAPAALRSPLASRTTEGVLLPFLESQLAEPVAQAIDGLRVRAAEQTTPIRCTRGWAVTSVASDNARGTHSRREPRADPAHSP